MAQVIDFFSRKPLGTKQDTEANDTQASEGRFIGNIGKNNANAYRSTLSVMESLYDKMSRLEDEIHDVENVHIHNMQYILDLLKAHDRFDISVEDLSVSEDGKVWIVPHRLPEE